MVISCNVWKVPPIMIMILILMAVYGSKNGIKISPTENLLQEAVQVQGFCPAGDAEGSKATV